MIRKISRNDRDAYLHMAHDFYHSPAVLHPIPEKHIIDTFEQLITSGPYIEGYVFETIGKCSGYALICQTYSQEAGGLVVWLDEFYVDPKFRGQGIGSEFLDYIEKHIPAARYRLEIEPENIRAEALYVSKGYEKVPYVQYVKEQHK